MHYQNQSQVFIQNLKEFFSFNKEGENKPSSTIVEVSQRLTNISKQKFFLNMIINLFSTYSFTKDEITLVTSLVKDKFKYDFETIDLQYLSEIYSKLLQIVKLLNKPTLGTFNNLCLTFTYIYINIISKDKESSVKQYLQPFTVEGMNFNYYFKILELIASEVDNSRIVIDEDERANAKRKLGMQQEFVLQMLNQIAPKVWHNEIGNQQIEKDCVLKAFSEWVNIKVNSVLVAQLPDHFLTKIIFVCLEKDEQAEAASECLKAIINLIKNPTQQKEIFGFIAPKIFNLNVIVDKLIKQDKLDDAEYYISLILQFSRKAVSLIVSEIQKAAPFISKIIEYSRNDLLTNIFDEVIGFWQRFLSELVDQKSHLQIENLIPYIQLLAQLYDSLCLHIEYIELFIPKFNTKTESQLSYKYGDIGDALENRDKMEDLFNSISEFMGKNIYLEMILSKMEAITGKDNKFWSELEAKLHTLIEPIEQYPSLDQNIEKLIKTYQNIITRQDSCPIIVWKSFLRVFCNLMSIKSKEEQLIKKLFYLISHCFANKMLISIAGKAFRVGCDLNGELLFSDIEHLIVSTVQTYPQQENLALGNMLICLKNLQVFNKYAPFILNIIYNHLLSLPIEHVYDRKQTMHSLISVLKLIKQSPQSDSCAPAIKAFTRQIWPFVIHLIQNPTKLIDDEDIQTERLVKILKHIMRILKVEFRQFIEDLYDNVIKSYEKYPICSYVYILEVAITVYSQLPDYNQFLMGIFIKFCQITYQHFIKAQNFQKYAFLVDDFIGMNKRFFIYNASLVMQSKQLDSILNLCINAFMGNTTPRVAKCAYSYYEAIFMVYWRKQFIEEYNNQIEGGDKFKLDSRNFDSHQALKKFLVDKSSEIISKMIQHLSKIPLETTRDCILDALLAQLKAFPEQNFYIWPIILDNLPHDILLRNEKDKIKQLLQMMKSNDFPRQQDADIGLRKKLHLISRRLSNAAQRRMVTPE